MHYFEDSYTRGIITIYTCTCRIHCCDCNSCVNMKGVRQLNSVQIFSKKYKGISYIHHTVLFGVFIGYR